MTHLKTTDLIEHIFKFDTIHLPLEFSIWVFPSHETSLYPILDGSLHIIGLNLLICKKKIKELSQLGLINFLYLKVPKVGELVKDYLEKDFLYNL